MQEPLESIAAERERFGKDSVLSDAAEVLGDMLAEEEPEPNLKERVEEIVNLEDEPVE